MVDKVNYSVRAVERTLRILRSFGTGNSTKTYEEIAKETDIPVSTAFKISQVLVREGFLELDADRSLYRIGLEAFRVGNCYLDGKALIEAASTWLDKLVERVGLSANLGMREGSTVVAVLSKPGTTRLRLTIPPGQSVPIYQAALGKALVQEFQDAELSLLLPPPPWPQATSNSITDLAQLRKDLQESRERGYTLDNEEGSIGIRCVGVPIRDHSGRIVAAASVSATTIEMTKQALPAIIQAVIDTGNGISVEMGFHPKECS